MTGYPVMPTTREFQEVHIASVFSNFSLRDHTKYLSLPEGGFGYSSLANLTARKSLSSGNTG